MIEMSNIFNNPIYIAAVKSEMDSIKERMDGMQMSPENSLLFLQRLMDDLYKKYYSSEVECGNCSFANCCHEQITTSNLEIQVILNRVKKDRSLVNWPRLKKQVNNFDNLKFAEKACPFLDEQKRCSIYDIRPSICRSHNVLKGSDPEKCKRLNDEKTDEVRNHQIDSFAFYLIDEHGAGNLSVELQKLI